MLASGQCNDYNNTEQQNTQTIYICFNKVTCKVHSSLTFTLTLLLNWLELDLKLYFCPKQDKVQQQVLKLFFIQQ